MHLGEGRRAAYVACFSRSARRDGRDPGSWSFRASLPIPERAVEREGGPAKGGPFSTGAAAGWPTFQPLKVAHFSTALDTTATEWVGRLGEAKRRGTLEAELRRLGFIPLIVVDEVGYIPFDPEAANLMFSLVSSRYERASLIVTSNKPFSAWGEIFGDDVVAAAMIDRLVHHAEILSLKGDSYRLRDKDLGRPPGHD